MLNEAEFRTLLVVAIGGAIVLSGEVVAIGVALGGGSLAAVILWLGGTALAAFATVAYGSGQAAGATRRLVEAAGVSLGAFVALELVDYDGPVGGFAFALAYAAAIGAGTALALPGRTPGRLAARLIAVPATAALVIQLETNTSVRDLGYLLPGFVAAAVGIADVVVDTVERRRILLGAALVVVPAGLLVGGVVLEDRRDERELREQRLAAQPRPATVGRERIAWMFPAPGFNSGPVVTGNVVVADAYDALYGIDADTGQGRWRVRLPGRDGLTQPIAEGGTLFYPANLAGLHAIDAQSGRRQWRFGPVGAWEPRGIALYGLDPATGHRRWRRPVEGSDVELSSHPEGARIETEQGRWLVEPSTGRLLPTGAASVADYTFGRSSALRPRSRSWIYRPGWEAATSEPLELGGLVFVNVDLSPPKVTGGLHVLDARTGRLQWRVEIAGDSEFRPAARGDLVYVTSTGACASLGGCRSGVYAIRHR